MKIFLSWSVLRSRAIAEALNDWLKVVQLPAILIGVIFHSGCTGTFESQQRQYAKPAQRALQRISAATAAGVNQTDYTRLVNDTQAKVSETARKTANHEFKEEILIAVRIYTDALEFWRSAESEEVEEAHSAVHKLTECYEILKARHTSDGSIFTYSRTDVLRLLWATANSHIAKAENALVPRENYKPFG